MVQGFQRNFKATRKLYLIYKLISKEFNEYLKSGSMLEARKLFKQAATSYVWKRSRIHCSVWFYRTVDASSLSREDFVTESGQLTC